MDEQFQKFRESEKAVSPPMQQLHNETASAESPNKKSKLDETMKNIIVIDNVVKEEFVACIDGEHAFRTLLETYQAKYLIDPEGTRFFSYSALVDSGTYTLGGRPTAGHEINEQSAGKSKQSRPIFDFGTLRRPENVLLPVISKDVPTFVTEDGWLNRVYNVLEGEFKNTDISRRDTIKVRPIAVAGRSLSGKTRSLKELCHYVRTIMPETGVIFCSFSGHSLVVGDEEADPTLALCRRIVFEAQRCRTVDEDRFLAYRAFQERNYIIDYQEFGLWLCDSKVILVVDELNNLKSATAKGTATAAYFGRFIRDNFLVAAGRCFVFSTHELTTVKSLLFAVDNWKICERDVAVLTLPIVDNVKVASDELNPNLNGARDVLFHALMPGMIFSVASGMITFRKQQAALSDFCALTDEEIMTALTAIFQSTITGGLRNVPPCLHCLLNIRGSPIGNDKVFWAPFLLENLLRDVIVSDAKVAKMAANMADLLLNFKNASEGSGDAWENLFTFQLVSRCYARLPDDYFVPADWFADDNVGVEFNNRQRLNGRLSEYKTLRQLIDGLIVSDDPTVSVYWSDFKKFAKVDVVAFHWDNGELLDCFVYQLKEGRTAPSNKTPAPDDDTFADIPGCCKCFWVRGKPAQSKQMDKFGWDVPSSEVIIRFFGESGWYWTPEQWRKLTNTDINV